MVGWFFLLLCAIENFGTNCTLDTSATTAGKLQLNLGTCGFLKATILCDGDPCCPFQGKRNIRFQFQVLKKRLGRESMNPLHEWFAPIKTEIPVSSNRKTLQYPPIERLNLFLPVCFSFLPVLYQFSFVLGIKIPNLSSELKSRNYQHLQSIREKQWILVWARTWQICCQKSWGLVPFLKTGRGEQGSASAFVLFTLDFFLQ